MNIKTISHVSLLFYVVELKTFVCLIVYIRSDNGPEFVAEAVKTFLGNSGVETLSIEPGSPWENGYIESFTARM